MLLLYLCSCVHIFLAVFFAFTLNGTYLGDKYFTLYNDNNYYYSILNLILKILESWADFKPLIAHFHCILCNKTAFMEIRFGFVDVSTPFVEGAMVIYLFIYICSMYYSAAFQNCKLKNLCSRSNIAQPLFFHACWWVIAKDQFALKWSSVGLSCKLE